MSEPGEHIQSGRDAALANERAVADAADARRSRGGPRLPAILVLLLIGAVGLYGWRVFRSARQAEPARIAKGNHKEGNAEPLVPSTSPVGPSEPVVVEPAPIAPDLPPPESVEELLGEARRTGDRLVRLFPNDPDALEVKARIQYYVGDYPAAIACWERCLQLNPDYGYAYHGLGLVAAKRAEYEEAAVQQGKAFTLAVGLPDFAVELADTLMKLGQLDEAIEVLDRHLAVNPKSARGQLTLGHAHLQAKQYGKARDAYRAALRLHPEMPRAQFGLATALARLGNREESREAMERYKVLEAKKIEFRRNLRSQFDDLEAVCVDFAVHFTHASRVCLAHGDLAEAERLCRRAVTLDPNDTRCRTLLASLYLHQGHRLADAARLAREAVRIEPTAANWFLACQANAAGGDRAEAVAAIRKAIELDPANRQYRQVLRRLQESE